MEDLVNLLLILFIIYSVLIIFTLLLVSKLYKSYLVCGTKTKEIITTGTFNYSSGDSGDKVTSYFSFKTKDGKNINCGTSLFPITKKGKKKYFFYNANKNEIVAKIYTIVWQSFFFMINILYSLIIGIPFFIIALLLVITTIVIYAKHYQKKYLKGTK